MLLSHSGNLMYLSKYSSSDALLTAWYRNEFDLSCSALTADIHNLFCCHNKQPFKSSNVMTVWGSVTGFSFVWGYRTNLHPVATAQSFIRLLTGIVALRWQLTLCVLLILFLKCDDLITPTAKPQRKVDPHYLFIFIFYQVSMYVVCRLLDLIAVIQRTYSVSER